MKKSLVIIAAILVIVLPVGILLGMLFMLPPQYSNTFVGELDEKYNRLMEIDEPKIIVLGGSSVAFGLESEIIEEYTGMPVVNFGLYAALGTKVMLDLSKGGINEGDIVVLAPELDPQTMSMYFSSETTLQAIDDQPSMIFSLDINNVFSVIGAMFKHVGQKLEYMRDGAPNPSGVYNSKNFNEYGDLEYDRPENAMALYYDPNTMINLNESILDPAFIDYLNEYIDFVGQKGATAYFSFAPMNEMGLADGVGEDALYEFADAAAELIDCAQISDITDYVYSAGYFYDTNYHLNDAGMQLHTIKLSQDVLFALERFEVVKAEKPKEPPLPLINVDYEKEDDPNAKYFTFEKAGNGAYIITGLTEEGKQMTELTLPLGYKNKKVLYVGEGAFEGGVLTSLIIPYDSNIKSFFENAFLGASTLTDLYILYPNMDPNDETISPPPDFAGVSPSFVVHIPPDSSYDSGYFWSERGLKFVKDIE